MKSPLRRCAWCKRSLEGQRRHARFCSVKCRQAGFRARRYYGRAAGSEGNVAHPLRFAYADPPYPDTAKKYYGKDPLFAGEIDHRALIERLRTFDGWALSTSAKALRAILPLCPEGARVCSWQKPGAAFTKRSSGLFNVWEPLIVVPGRLLRPATRDALSCMPARGGGTLWGRKPLRFCSWLFRLLGMQPGDELEDLFPGTGIVGKAWRELSPPPKPPRSVATSSATLPPIATIGMLAAPDRRGVFHVLQRFDVDSSTGRAACSSELAVDGKRAETPSKVPKRRRCTRNGCAERFSIRRAAANDGSVVPAGTTDQTELVGGRYAFRRCCGAQAGAPHFKVCPVVPLATPAPAPPRIFSSSELAAPAPNGRFHALSGYNSLAGGGFTTKGHSAACDHRLELEYDEALTMADVAEELRCRRSTCASLFLDADAKADARAKRKRRSSASNGSAMEARS